MCLWLFLRFVRICGVCWVWKLWILFCKWSRVWCFCIVWFICCCLVLMVRDICLWCLVCFLLFLGINVLWLVLFLLIVCFFLLWFFLRVLSLFFLICFLVSLVDILVSVCCWCLCIWCEVLRWIFRSFENELVFWCLVRGCVLKIICLIFVIRVLLRLLVE